MENSNYCRIGISLLAVMCSVSVWAQAPAVEAASRTADVAPVAASGTGARNTQSAQNFIIGEDDLLAISVWKEPDLTKQIPVRSDGKISLPLIGDIQAAGRTPSQLERDITNTLRSYISDPQVSVIVQEIRSLKFNILGQVNKPGVYPLATGTTIVDAIALANGFRDFAKTKGVYVLRPNPNGPENRYSFNYQDYLKGKNTDRNIVLRPHDTVVVP